VGPHSNTERHQAFHVAIGILLLSSDCLLPTHMSADQPRPDNVRPAASSASSWLAGLQCTASAYQPCLRHIINTSLAVKNGCMLGGVMLHLSIKNVSCTHAINQCLEMPAPHHMIPVRTFCTIHTPLMHNPPRNRALANQLVTGTAAGSTTLLLSTATADAVPRLQNCTANLYLANAAAALACCFPKSGPAASRGVALPAYTLWARYARMTMPAAVAAAAARHVGRAMCRSRKLSCYVYHQTYWQNGVQIKTSAAVGPSLTKINCTCDRQQGSTEHQHRQLHAPDHKRHLQACATVNCITHAM
jgi:hypothetical protein